MLYLVWLDTCVMLRCSMLKISGCHTASSPSAVCKTTFLSFFLTPNPLHSKRYESSAEPLEEKCLWQRSKKEKESIIIIVVVVMMMMMIISASKQLCVTLAHHPGWCCCGWVILIYHFAYALNYSDEKESPDLYHPFETNHSFLHILTQVLCLTN